VVNPKFLSPRAAKHKAGEGRAKKFFSLPLTGRYAVLLEASSSWSVSLTSLFFGQINHRYGGFCMQLKPLHDRILVKRLEEEQVTKGGIIIPDSAKEKPIKGEVVAVGQGKTADDGKLIPMNVKQGDKVIFNKYAGTEIKIEGEEFLIMREDDVLAIIEG
jgi:chaperonin GroES